MFVARSKKCTRLSGFVGIFRFTVLSLFFILLLAPAGRAEITPASSELKISSAYSSFALEPGKPVTVNILVDIDVPAFVPPKSKERPPVAISLVIDRSGSMSEANKLDYAIKAGKTIVRGLNAQDMLALTIYDDEVEVIYPLSKVKDKDKIIKLLEGISDRNYTNLSGGLEAGIAQFNDKKFEGVRRVILLSDGLANRGETNPELIAKIGAQARAKGIAVSSIGLGLDYDENLMELLAQRGGGQYYYVKDSEDLPGVFKQELALAEEAFSRDLKVLFTPSAAVSEVKIFGYNQEKENGATQIEMSDLAFGEKRQVVMAVTLTPDSDMTNQSLGDMKISYLDAKSKQEKSVALPFEVQVLKEEKARELANQREATSIKRVQEEALLQVAEEAHVEAMTALQAGDTDRARSILKEQQAAMAPAAAENKVLENKMARMAMDEKNLTQASANQEMQQSMVKQSKESKYKSAQGSTQAYLLKPGDKGYLVEKLQTALTEKGFYKGEISGLYDQAVQDAVKAFQTSQKLGADGIAGANTMRALGM